MNTFEFITMNIDKNIEYFNWNIKSQNFDIEKTNLNIIYLNIRSIRNKFLELEYYLNEFKIEYDIIVLVETWLSLWGRKFF